LTLILRADQPIFPLPFKFNFVIHIEMQEAEYYNKIGQNMDHLGDVRKTNLTPHIVDETGRYQRCEGERKTPFELLTLQDLVLHHLHQRLRIQTAFYHRKPGPPRTTQRSLKRSLRSMSQT